MRTKKKLEADFLRRNPLTPQTAAPSSKLRLNLNHLDRDRCHRMSSLALKELVVNYANGHVSWSEFEDVVNAVIDTDADDLREWHRYRGPFRQALADAAIPAMSLAMSKQVGEAAVAMMNRVYNLLFSATRNSSIGHRTTNQEIGESNDLNFRRNAQNKLSLTPRSRRILKSQNATQHVRPGFRQDTDGNDTSVRSSQMRDGRGGRARMRSMSPETQNEVSKQIRR